MNELSTPKSVTLKSNVKFSFTKGTRNRHEIGRTRAPDYLESDYLDSVNRFPTLCGVSSHLWTRRRESGTGPVGCEGLGVMRCSRGRTGRTNSQTERSCQKLNLFVVKAYQLVLKVTTKILHEIRKPYLDPRNICIRVN